MAEVALNIDPPVWNVLKFLILSVVATPLLELLFDHLLSTKATYDVLQGHQIVMSDSRLGAFTLHATYWGSSRNKLKLLMLGVIVILAELLFEFSFSVAAVDITETERVYLPPSHHSRYSVSDTVYLSAQTSAEPSQFLEQTTGVCLNGPSFMLRYRNNHPDAVLPDEEGLLYVMNGTYTIRNPYLAADNLTIVCSTTRKIAPAFFTVPRVISIRQGTNGEGFKGSRNSSGFNTVRHAFSQGPFRKLGLLQLQSYLSFVMANDDIVCLKPRTYGFFCAMMRDYTSSLINATLFETSKPPEEFTMAVVLQATGKAIQGLHDINRRIRLLASLAGTRFMSAHRGGFGITQRLVGKDDLELISLMTLMAANEEGVGGVKETLGTRVVRKGERQSATVKHFAIIPISILLALMLSFIIVDMVLCTWIDKISKYEAEPTRKIWQRLTRQPRVKTTKEWLRERIACDVSGFNAQTTAKAEEVAVKIVQGDDEQYLQVLPGMAAARMRDLPLRGCLPEYGREQTQERLMT